MVMIIAINIMFAPILGYVDSLHREAVEVVLSEGARKAAVEGYFSNEIIDEMKQKLVDNYNFDPDDVKIQTSHSAYPVARGEYINASIEIPRGIIFLLDIFNPGPKAYKKEITVMSEFID